MSTVTEPESMAELIEDCAEIPEQHAPVRPRPRAARDWQVDDACLARVEDLDEYV